MRYKEICTDTEFNEEVELIIRLRDIANALEIQSGAVREAIKDIELNLIRVVEYDFERSDRFTVKVFTKEEKQIDWQAEFVKVAGDEAAQNLQDQTETKLYKGMDIFSSENDPIKERSWPFRYPI